MKTKNKELYDRKVNKMKLNIGDLVLVEKQPHEKFKPILSGSH